MNIFDLKLLKSNHFSLVRNVHHDTILVRSEMFQQIAVEVLFPTQNSDRFEKVRNLYSMISSRKNRYGKEISLKQLYFIFLITIISHKKLSIISAPNGNRITDAPIWRRGTERSSWGSHRTSFRKARKQNREYRSDLYSINK